MFAGIRIQPEIGSEQSKRVTGGYQRTLKTTLGVKWSQVQILSARPRLLQFRGSFGEIWDRSSASIAARIPTRIATPSQSSRRPSWLARLATAARAVLSEVWPYTSPVMAIEGVAADCCRLANVLQQQAAALRQEATSRRDTTNKT